MTYFVMRTLFLTSLILSLFSWMYLKAFEIPIFSELNSLSKEKYKAKSSLNDYMIDGKVMLFEEDLVSSKNLSNALFAKLLTKLERSSKEPEIKENVHSFKYFKPSDRERYISPFDHLFQEHAKKLDWNWMLLASQAFQESSFNPEAVSKQGARGLMQIMPSTGLEFGSRNLDDPAESIRISTLFLKKLYKSFAYVPDLTERLKFTLAAYNAGKGHVEDARRLAKKYGEDSYVWTAQTELWMLKKSEAAYYKDEVVKYGYCRGSEPVDYVNRILDRFNQYQTLSS